MATLKGIERTKQDTVPADLRDQGSKGGVMRVLYDKYAPAGALSLNDVIQIGQLPAGARVVGFWLKSSDLGTTGTLDLGWAASSDGVEAANATGFLAAVDVNAAAISISTSDQENQAGLGKKFSSAVEVQIKASAATTAAGTIEACVQYVVD
jgi:hypothetical protein